MSKKRGAPPPKLSIDRQRAAERELTEAVDTAKRLKARARDAKKRVKQAKKASKEASKAARAAKKAAEKARRAYKKTVERASKKRKKAAKEREPIATPKRTTPSRSERARNEIVWRQQRPVGRGGDDETRAGADAVGVRPDCPQLLVRRHLPLEQLNQLDPRLRTDLPQVRLERLDEDRRARGVPSVPIERGQQAILQRQADAAEVGRVLRLRVDADRASELVPQLLRQLDHLVEGRHLEPAVPAV